MEKTYESFSRPDQLTGVNGDSVLVIGAGVIGLTSALCLARKGFRVTLVADRFAPQVTSVVAGALWEWPPAVCGQHQSVGSLVRAKGWSATSYRVFAGLADTPETGVFLRPVTFYLKRPLREDARLSQKVNEYKDKVDQFRHDAALIAEHGINPDLGFRDAYTQLAPMIDTDDYLRWLLDEVVRAGCRVVEDRIVGSLRNQEKTLLRRYGAAAIVNCAGLGARELTDDPMTPLRGALIRVRNDGTTIPRITEAHCVSHDGSTGERGFIFIVPRGRDMLVLGGIAEPDEWGLDVTLDNYEPVREMYRRCVEFLPALRGAEIDAAEPVRVGLRPFRRAGVRLEREAGTRIIHNYGHGGSGVTYSWGCALEVTEQVERLLHSSGDSHWVEVFTKGCPSCAGAIAYAHELAASSADYMVQVWDVNQQEGATRMSEIGICDIPGIAVDDEPLACCEQWGLRAGPMAAFGLHKE